MKAFYCIVLGLSLLKLTESQYDTHCNTRETCGECIQTPNCVWCSELNINTRNGTFKSRCENKYNVNRDAWCSADNIYDPENQVYILANEPMQSQIRNGSHTIQIKPQNIKLSLRKDAEYFLDFQYQHAETKVTQNPANVATLMSGNYYNNIADSIVITDNSSNAIEIKYSSNCPKPRENGCNNVHAGEIINFQAVIRALECQPVGLNTHKIIIKPEEIDASLELELQIICDCPCEKPVSY